MVILLVQLAGSALVPGSELHAASAAVMVSAVAAAINAFLFTVVSSLRGAFGLLCLCNTAVTTGEESNGEVDALASIHESTSIRVRIILHYNVVK